MIRWIPQGFINLFGLPIKVKALLDEKLGK